MTINYLIYALTQDDQAREDKQIPRIIFGALTLLLHIDQLYNEFVQINGSEGGLRDHFDSIWNYNDAVWLTICPIILVSTLPNDYLISNDVLIIMSTFVTFSLFVKLMDWMRIFSNTSFYVYLIQETIKRIQAFLLLLIICLLMFGIPMVMLNINR